MNHLEVILDKYFKDGKVKYYHPADAIFDDQYIRWDYHQHKKTEILISIGSSEGEVRVNIFTDSQDLENFIKLAIY